MNVFKNKKRWKIKKNVKKRKKRALNKKRKKTFFYIYDIQYALVHHIGFRLIGYFLSSRARSTADKKGEGKAVRSSWRVIPAAQVNSAWPYLRGHVQRVSAQAGKAVYALVTTTI